MTPAARAQTAIELLDQIVAAARTNGPPADRILSEGFRQRRYAGSKDRRAIRDLVYAAIRANGEPPPSGRAAVLGLIRYHGPDSPPKVRHGLDWLDETVFDGSSYGPAPIAGAEAVWRPILLAGWASEQVFEALDRNVAEAEALLARAPLDIRVNTLKASRDSLVLPETGEWLPAANGLRLPHGTQVEQWDAYREGLIEVQDCGSQLACLAAGVQPGETVIDLCAGAGGKTLALAAAMENKGTLVAADTDRGRLSQLGPRAERAGAAIAETVLLDPGKELEALAKYHGSADCVLVDAPCSGTGTWRRNPEGRWRLKPEALVRYTQAQSRLLAIAAQLVKPKGRIVYVTCSLLDSEGDNRIAEFLLNHPEWQAEPPTLPLGRPGINGIRLTPCHDGTDGFFIARICRS